MSLGGRQGHRTEVLRLVERLHPRVFCVARRSAGRSNECYDSDSVREMSQELTPVGRAFRFYRGDSLKREPL